MEIQQQSLGLLKALLHGVEKTTWQHCKSDYHLIFLHLKEEPLFMNQLSKSLASYFHAEVELLLNKESNTLFLHLHSLLIVSFGRVLS